MQNKRHNNGDAEELRPQKRKRGDGLERSLSRLQIDEQQNAREMDSDIEMSKSGSYDADKNRIIVYDLDEFNSDEENVELSRYKVPKLPTKTHDLIFSKLTNEQQQQQQGQLVLYQPLQIPPQHMHTHNHTHTHSSNADEAMEL